MKVHLTCRVDERENRTCLREIALIVRKNKGRDFKRSARFHSQWAWNYTPLFSNTESLMSSRGSILCDRGDLYFVVILNSIQDLIFSISVLRRTYDKREQRRDAETSSAWQNCFNASSPL